MDRPDGLSRSSGSAPLFVALHHQQFKTAVLVPEHGADPAWVLFDDDNIYVSCRCLMADMSQVVANDMRRDSTNLRHNDNFGVFLDTFHDRRNGYLFYVSPVGGMFDGATANERTNNVDWNTIWDAKVTRSADGWVAEIAIPFKSLRYNPGREQTWGINLRRTIRGRTACRACWRWTSASSTTAPGRQRRRTRGWASPISDGSGPASHGSRHRAEHLGERWRPICASAGSFNPAAGRLALKW